MQRPQWFDPASQDQNDRAAYWGCLNPEELARLFWQVPRSSFLSLTPSWDFSEFSRYHNSWLPEEYLNACRLYECNYGDLLTAMDEHENYLFHNIWKKAQKNPFLRVVGRWKHQQPVSPPVLKWTRSKKFRKYDGFHRLVAAFAVNPKTIPFFAVLDELPWWIREVYS